MCNYRYYLIPSTHTTGLSGAGPCTYSLTIIFVIVIVIVIARMRLFLSYVTSDRKVIKTSGKISSRWSS